MKKFVCAALGALMLAGASGGVLTTTSVITASPADAWPRKVRIHCKRDYKRFCRRYKVGSARMTSCMRSYRNHLSPVCKKMLIESGVARRFGY